MGRKPIHSIYFIVSSLNAFGSYLLYKGDTLEEIAEKLGYKNHSGVLKRIRKIGLALMKSLPAKITALITEKSFDNTY